MTPAGQSDAAVGELAGRVAMTPELVEALAGLRDLQTASGGDAIAVLVSALAAIVVLACLAAWRYRHRLAALRRLQRLQREFERTAAAPDFASGVARLLREAAARRHPPMPPGLTSCSGPKASTTSSLTLISRTWLAGSGLPTQMPSPRFVRSASARISRPSMAQTGRHSVAP